MKIIQFWRFLKIPYEFWLAIRRNAKRKFAEKSSHSNHVTDSIYFMSFEADKATSPSTC